jgi:hypothetical protein
MSQGPDQIGSTIKKHGKVEMTACVFRVNLNGSSVLVLGCGEIALFLKTYSKAEESIDMPRAKGESRKVLGLGLRQIATAFMRSCAIAASSGCCDTTLLLEISFPATFFVVIKPAFVVASNAGIIVRFFAAMLITVHLFVKSRTVPNKRFTSRSRCFNFLVMNSFGYDTRARSTRGLTGGGLHRRRVLF